MAICLSVIHFKPRIWLSMTINIQTGHKTEHAEKSMSYSKKTFWLNPLRKKKNSSWKLESIKNKTVKEWQYGDITNSQAFLYRKFLTAENPEELWFFPRQHRSTFAPQPYLFIYHWCRTCSLSNSYWQHR